MLLYNMVQHTLLTVGFISKGIVSNFLTLEVHIIHNPAVLSRALVTPTSHKNRAKKENVALSCGGGLAGNQS